MARPRQREGVQTRVYAYACAVPTEGWAAAVAEQARQWDLWDALVRMDAQLRERELVQAEADPVVREARKALDAAQTALEQALAERRAARQAARGRIETPALDARIRALLTARREASRTLWTAVAAWRRAHAAEVQALRQERAAAVSTLRRQSGCYWGYYNRVLDAYERARTQGFRTGRPPRPIDPRRRDGVLTVQIQRTRTGLGAAPDEVLAGKAGGAVALVPTPQGPGTHRLILRIDAAGHRLVCPVWLHRPLPPNGRIKSVQWTWQRGEAHWRYQVAFTVTCPAPPAPAHPSTDAAGLDLGYRRQADGGLLVGTLVGSDRSVRRYVLPASWLAALDYAESLLGSSDDRRRQEGFNLRARLLRRRREWYRLWARDLCRDYAALVLEEWDLGTVARVRRSEAEAEAQAEAPIRAQRHRAALSQWRLAIEQQAAKTGTRLLWEDPAYTTLRCHACGHQHAANQVDRLAVRWVCHGCGAEWDQDINAARNLLAAVTRERGNAAAGDTTSARGVGRRMSRDKQDRSKKLEKNQRTTRGSPGSVTDEALLGEVRDVVADWPHTRSRG